MSRQRTVLLIGVLCIALLAGAACGSPGGNPESVVDDYWKSMQDGDIDQARTMIASGRESSVSGLGMDLLEDMGDMDEIEKSLYDRIKIRSTGSTQDGETAIVNVTVTMPDMKQTFLTFFQESFGELMEMAFSGVSDDEMEILAAEKLIEAMDGAKDVTYNETAELRLEDGDWKIYDWNFDNFEKDMNDLQDEMSDWMDGDFE